jgi:hypothetical protein
MWLGLMMDVIIAKGILFLRNKKCQFDGWKLGKIFFSHVQI